jgi:hypothetical protein
MRLFQGEANRLRKVSEADRETALQSQRIAQNAQTKQRLAQAEALLGAEAPQRERDFRVQMQTALTQEVRSAHEDRLGQYIDQLKAGGFVFAPNAVPKKDAEVHEKASEILGMPKHGIGKFLVDVLGFKRLHYRRDSTSKYNGYRNGATWVTFN